MFPDPLYLRLLDTLWWYLGLFADDEVHWELLRRDRLVYKR